MISNKEIIKYLTSKTINAGLIDKLKIKYRPIICPFDKLLAYADGKNTAFDIGCGSGQFVSLLAKFTALTTMYGVEISEKLVLNARAINTEFASRKTLQFNTFDGKILPDTISKADIVYIIDVIHHVPKLQQTDFIKEIYQKMKPGATLIFKDINANSPLVLFNKLHDMIFAGEIGKEMAFESTKSFLNQIGFKIKQSFLQTIFVYPHYFIICEK